MSLAENLLNSLDENAYQNSEISGIEPEEEHIVVGENRAITVPNKLKIIAVTGDKDIETVAIDCIRYWDGHDLSSFAVYINYRLPNGETGTYIPQNITKNDDHFTFEWVIGREITQYNGKISFLILARQVDDSGNLLYQWSSLLNSECAISQGLDITNITEEELSQDVVTQILQNLNSKLSYSNISNELGYSEETVLSQKTTTVELNNRANALKGSVSGSVVAMNDVSPLEHELDVKVSSKNIEDISSVEVKRYGKNLLPPFDAVVTTDGVTATFKDGYVTFSGALAEGVSSVMLYYLYPAEDRLYLPAGKYVTGGFEPPTNVYVSGYSSLDDDRKWVGDIYTSGMEMKNAFYLQTLVVYVTSECIGKTFPLIMKSGTTMFNASDEFEPYIEPTTCAVEADGTVKGVTPLYPSTTLITDNRAIIECEYNRDINKAFEELRQIILSLGGNI